jgi:diacylglycerol kinase family enzyme
MNLKKTRQVIVLNKKILLSNSYLERLRGISSRDVFFSKDSKEASEFILKKNPEIIELYGGDGTFSSTLNEVLKVDGEFLNDRYVKIIPAGTGNDKFKSLKEYKNDLNAKSRNKKQQDSSLEVVVDDFLVAKVNDKYQRFIFNEGGIGLNSQTILNYESIQNKNLPPSLQYLIAATNSISKLNGFESHITYNSKNFLGTLKNPLMFLFMLGKYFGGGMPINNDFELGDGFFETGLFKRGNKFDLYSSLFSLSVLKKNQKKNPLANYLPKTDELSIEISGSDKFYFESDGELLKQDSKVIEIKSLNVKTFGKISYLV